MFNKFLHIENHTNFKDGYVMLEKIDGANIQFIFEKGELVNVASRNQIITNDYDFNGYKKVIEKQEFIDLFNKLKEISKEKNVNIFGEIYGNNIQKNIDYCKEPNIKFFALQINNEYASFSTFKKIVENENLIVPIIGYYGTIEEALKFDVDNFKSIVANNGEIAEGVIIEPVSYWDDRRIIKYKSQKFKEVSKNPILAKLNIINYNFEDYLTENRLKNILSHYDKNTLIDKKSKVEVLKEFVEDGKKDFEKDVDLNQFEKSDLKRIFKYDFNKYYNILEELINN